MVTKISSIATRRDSEETKARILEALARIIVRDGLAAVGVNSLAREAGCDKVLIYRYFCDLDGVYRAYAERGDIWHTTAEILAGIDPTRMSLADALKLCLRHHSSEIRKRPLTIAVLAAELSQRTQLVAALEAVRERRANALTAWLAEHYEPPNDVDLQATGLLISAAINYLAVRARNTRVMSGVPIKTDEDWERLLAAADQMIDRVLSQDLDSASPNGRRRPMAAAPTSAAEDSIDAKAPRLPRRTYPNRRMRSSQV